MHGIKNAGSKDNQTISFSWNITDWCNYDCSYCYSKGTLEEKFSRNNYRQPVVDFVIKRLERLDADFEIDFSGGETSIHPYLNSILEKLCAIPRCKNITINTNLSRSLRYYQKLYKDPRILIIATYHPEYHNAEYLHKAIHLKGENFACRLNISDKQEHLELLKGMVEKLKEYGVRYGFNRLYTTEYRNIEYPPAAYEIYKTMNTPQDTYRYEYTDGTVGHFLASEIYEQKLNKFTGYKCQPLKYIIDFSGKIRRECGMQEMPVFFNVEKLKQTITCPMSECTCDILLGYYKEQQ